jgi:hypothetical protein
VRLRNVEVDQDDLGLVLGNEDVLGLDIPVHYLLGMQVVDALKDLPKEVLGVALGIGARAGDFVEDL